MYDILIRGGMVYDGTGSPPVRADVAIKDGSIFRIGTFGKSEAAREVIDATDLFVTPGFVDANNHSDTHWRLFAKSGLESLIRQGITTIVGGTCGSSLAPLLHDRAFDSIRKWTDVRAVNVDWRSVEELWQRLQKTRLMVNVSSLAGYGTIRRGLIGDENRALTEEEVRKAVSTIETAMAEGMVGFSMGRAYTHERNASDEEIRHVMRAVSKLGGVVSVHLRDEFSAMDYAVLEEIERAKATGARLHITHLKALLSSSGDSFSTVLSRISDAKSQGVSVSFDVFPYDFTGSVLYLLLPEWASAGGRDAMLGRLADASTRRQIAAEMRKSPMAMYDKMVLSRGVFFDHASANRSIADIARLRSTTPEEVIMQTLVASEGRAIVRMNVLDEEKMEEAMQHSLSMITSDGAGYSERDSISGEWVHPRCFGAFPRFLGRYVRDKKVLSWEEAICKITAFPAKRFGLARRGELREGFAADITVFDPETILDEATARHPFRYSRGVEYVAINGKTVLKEGICASDDAGEVIRYDV
jgi:N-acyl-D-amino-acid deacylase